MKLFYALFILLQLAAAILQRDQDRIAYLKYLWSNPVDAPNSPGKPDNLAFYDSEYRETRTDSIRNEYSLLLER